MPQDYVQLGKQIPISFITKLPKYKLLKQTDNSPVYRACTKSERVTTENFIQNIKVLGWKTDAYWEFYIKKRAKPSLK